MESLRYWLIKPIGAYKAIHRHRVVLPPGTFTLVPVGNTNRCLRIALGTGWCYQPVPLAHPWVTTKGKYLPLNQKWCVGEMVRELHARQEVAGSNPGHRTRMCGSLPGLIYSFGQNYLATGFLRYPCQRTMPKVPLLGYRLKNRYLRPLLTGT